jgi:hypothetical protein
LNLLAAGSTRKKEKFKYRSAETVKKSKKLSASIFPKKKPTKNPQKKNPQTFARTGGRRGWTEVCRSKK